MSGAPPTPSSRASSEEIKSTSGPDAEKGSLSAVNDPRFEVMDDANAASPGVARIEALYLVFGRGWKIWGLYISLGLIAYIAALAGNTLYVYLPFATSSFGQHSLLGAINTAVSIMSTVSKPFIAKIADISSRPTAYLMCLFFYTLGLVILAASSTVNAIAAGQVIMVIGSTGLDLVTTIILGDITSLKWRGFSQGLISMPYVVNAFISGYITEDIGLANWRWGYGMFAILLPAVMAPALIILFWADIQARKIGAVSVASSSYAMRVAEEKLAPKSWTQLAVQYYAQIDGTGLVLFGASWSLILLPFTLYPSAKGGFANPSMIAMEVVGWVLFVAFLAWEFFFAKYPLMPKRILNKTFWMCVIIDFLYYFSGYLASNFYSSWVWVVKDWSVRDYTFFNNILTVGLCFFGLCWGLLMRYTHEYKYTQLAGVCIRLIGMGLKYYAVGDNASDAVLIMSEVLISLGGAASVIGTQVASQASVPHADMATTISLLSLWTGLGGSFGTTASTSVWKRLMPINLANRLAGIADQATIDEIFGSITVARDGSPEVRAATILAYNDTVQNNLFLPALVLAAIPIIACIFTVPYYLGDTQNAIENKEVVLQANVDEEELARKGREIEERALAARQAHT